MRRLPVAINRHVLNLSKEPNNGSVKGTGFRDSSPLRGCHDDREASELSLFSLAKSMPRQRHYVWLVDADDLAEVLDHFIIYLWDIKAPSLPVYKDYLFHPQAECLPRGTEILKLGFTHNGHLPENHPLRLGEQGRGYSHYRNRIHDAPCSPATRG